MGKCCIVWFRAKEVPLKALSLFLLFAIAASGGAIACGGSDSTGPEIRARRTTAVVGDSQSAPTGAVLPIPLSFVVLDAGDVPLVGATVNWKVVSGTAALSPSSSKTDANGTAQTTVTLGNTIGPVIVRGTVGTVSPVNFNLSALDPCAYAAPYTVGSTVNGALTTGDCHQIIGGSGYYYDYYGFTAGTQQGVTVTMSSTSFDTWIDFYGGPDTAHLDVVGFNNDLSSTSTNSLMQIIVAPGAYQIGANSNRSNATGPYTLTSAVRPQTISRCQVIFLTRGISVSDSVTATDCGTDFQGNAGYGDAALIFLRAGSVVTLSEQSAVINPELKLYVYDSTFGNVPPVAINDDSAAGTSNAFISYPVPVTNFYVIFIGTSAPSQTGAYTFNIASSTTAAGSKARPEPLRFPPMPSRWPLSVARRN